MRAYRVTYRIIVEATYDLTANSLTDAADRFTKFDIEALIDHSKAACGDVAMYILDVSYNSEGVSAFN